MSTCVKKTSTYNNLVPAGKYIAKIISITPSSTKSGYITITFDLQGYGTYRTLYPLELHYGNRTDKLIKNFLDTKEIPDTFDLDDLINKKCEITIIHTNKENRTFANINECTFIRDDSFDECDEVDTDCDEFDDEVDTDCDEFDDEVDTDCDEFDDEQGSNYQHTHKDVKDTLNLNKKRKKLSR